MNAPMINPEGFDIRITNPVLSFGLIISGSKFRHESPENEKNPISCKKCSMNGKTPGIEKEEISPKKGVITISGALWPRFPAPGTSLRRIF